MIQDETRKPQPSHIDPEEIAEVFRDGGSTPSTSPYLLVCLFDGFAARSYDLQNLATFSVFCILCSFIGRKPPASLQRI